MFDWIFAFLHLFLLIGLFVYGVSSLIQGNILRTALILSGLGIYYLVVLHKAVKKEVRRKFHGGKSSKKHL